MPQLDVVSRSEAELKTAGESRAKVLVQYIEFIEGLTGDQAGRLEASEGETPRTVRRRLGDAGRLIGNELVIKKDGEVIYFWIKARRPGRPRNS
jgi:hypothetical protein